ncbi:MAG: histidine phosphatase family protein, partial [Polyangiales bacterium]
EHGRRQARLTAQRLARGDTRLDAIYCSDLRRAAETAELIGEPFGITPQQTPALRERSVGVFTGLRFDEAQERFPNDYASLLQREPDARPPEGESYRECGQRVAGFLREALATHPGQRILFVSHHLALYLLLLEIFGLQIPADGPQVYIRIDNCALHELEYHSNAVWQVLSINDIAHLAH